MSQSKERRGFASLTPEKRREIASLGGRTAHKKGVAHTFDHDLAVKAGRKGGKASRGGRGKAEPPSEE
jgi:general stress protein YciG